MITNLQELKDRANILEVVEQFLPLKKAGANYTHNCPFHNEKTPSFFVNPAKNIFSCFGCGKSGDSIKFLQEYKKLSFIEAVEEVANILNFTLEYEKSQNHTNTKSLFEVLEKANEIFYKELQSQEKVLQYLHNRGLNDEMLKKYDFGYCSLRAINELKSLYSIDLLEKSGILKQGKCFLHFRVTIAIRDSSYKVRGFSGRTHPYNDFRTAPKYINSAENAIFKKSFILYGSYIAKASIKNTNQIIVCEGFMDTIAFHKFEYKNAVCCIGTAFNKSHLAHIYRLGGENCEIIFSFDNDEAGVNATLRALKLCYENHCYNTSVVILDSKEKDLGEFLTQQEKPKMLKIHGFKYFVKMSCEKAKSPQEKDKAYFECLKVINYAPPFVRADFEKVASSLLPKQAFNAFKTPSIPTQNKSHANAENTPQSRPYNLNNAILLTILQDDEFAYIAKSFLSPSDFVREQDFINALEKNYTALPFVKNATILSSDEWSISLEAFKKQGLQRQLNKALQDKDFKLAELLRGELIKIKNIEYFIS